MSQNTKQNENVVFLQDEILNTVDRVRNECENLTIVEVLGVLEHVKLSLWQATFEREDEAE